jgi:hypothetical protein
LEKTISLSQSLSISPSGCAESTNALSPSKSVINYNFTVESIKLAGDFACENHYAVLPRFGLGFFCWYTAEKEL